MASIEKLKLMKIAELFSLMSNYQEDANAAERAFVEFHSRYKQRFWNVCSEVCKFNRSADDKIIKEIFPDNWRKDLTFYTREYPSFTPTALGDSYLLLGKGE